VLVARLADAGADGEKHGNADQPQPQHRIGQPQETDGSGHRRQHHQHYDRYRQPCARRSRITKQHALGIAFVIAHRLPSWTLPH